MSWQAATLGGVLAERAHSRGANEAIVTQRERIDYAELAVRAGTIARSLIAIGIRRGDHVGVLMGNDAHWLGVFYGAALIGAVTVPVNTRFKSTELAFCLKQADCRTLVLAHGRACDRHALAGGATASARPCDRPRLGHSQRGSVVARISGVRRERGRSDLRSIARRGCA